MQITTVRIAVEADIARVRQVADRVATELGLERFARTRSVTACLELSRNALQYAGGGRVTFRAFADGTQTWLGVSVSDQGPGIPDRAQKLSGRAVLGGGTGLGGEGMGLGLRGVKRIADRFDLQTGSEGTVIEIGFRLSIPVKGLAERVARVGDVLLTLEKTDPVAELSRQNRDLAQVIAEQELLINEVHHRTGNNLALIISFIQLSRRGAQSAETKQVLSELDMRVHSVARVHQDLQRAQQSDQVELLPFLKSVSGHAMEAFTSDDRDIEIKVSGAPILVRSNVAIDLGLIAGELITNAFKHAFKNRETGVISVALEEDGRKESVGAYTLVVSDDGVGLADGTDKPERPDSLGWRMIRSMAARHGGVIETNGTAGFRTEIAFPKELAIQDEDENDADDGDDGD